MTEITYRTTAEDVASRSLQVTVPLERLAAAERRALREYTRQARIPGFRKGHVPEPVIRRRFEQEIRRHVLEILRESWDTSQGDELSPRRTPGLERDVRGAEIGRLGIRGPPTLELQAKKGSTPPVVTGDRLGGPEQSDPPRAKATGPGTGCSRELAERHRIRDNLVTPNGAGKPLVWCSEGAGDYALEELIMGLDGDSAEGASLPEAPDVARRGGEEAR